MNTSRVTMDIGGMTCASCVNVVQKTLSRTAGVEEANVNFATEAATVSFDASTVSVDDLVKAVEKAGYTADVTELDLCEAGCGGCRIRRDNGTCPRAPRCRRGARRLLRARLRHLPQSHPSPTRSRRHTIVA